MKVLHINCNYSNNKLHKTMLDHFGSNSINTVFCPMIYGKMDSTLLRENVIIEECFSKFDRLFYFVKQKKIKKKLNQKIDISDYDLIHAYTLFTDGNVAMRLSKETGIPYVVTVRGTDINEFFTYRPYLIGRGMKIMKNASKVFFLSECFKDKMMNQYVPQKLKKEISRKCVVIPNGIDDFWLNNIYHDRDIQKTEERIQEKRLRVLCVSQIYKDKNIPFVQKALQLLEDEGWKIEFSVVGKIVDPNEYSIITNNSSTRYYPAVDKQELIKHYRSNELFILLSHYETFGLVYAEAMSQGLPVLYTKGQGFDGQFEDGLIGYSTSDREIFIVKERILLACKNYRNISTNCLESSTQFNWDRIVDIYEQIYTETVVRGKEEYE